MKHIVLTGMMGTGKSTVGRRLAQLLGRSFVDTDHLIEEEEGRTIPAIFQQEGEGYFRQREVAVAKALAQKEELVIACGGGLPTVADAIGPLYDGGTVFFLNRDPREIYKTVSMAGRPLGQGGQADFLARFAQRETIYRQWSHYEITGHSTSEQAVTKILEVLP